MVKVPETYRGKPCIHGHGTRRYVSTGRCVVCISQLSKTNYQKRKAGLLPRKPKAEMVV